MQLFCTHLCTLVTSDNLTGNNPMGSNPASKKTIQCPNPWQSDAPGSGPGAGFGICCTVGQRATLLEPLGVQPVRREAAAPAQATHKSPKDRFALTVTVCPSPPSAHMGPQLPGDVNRAPTSSLRTSSCSGVAASLLSPFAVLCPVAVILAVHTPVQMEVLYSH